MPEVARPPGDARLKLLLATGLGIGYAPVAPGTFGSLPGLALAWVLSAAAGPWAVLVGLVVVAATGYAVAGGAAAALGARDPGPVVIDEVAGQMLTLLFVPRSVAVYALGFFLFRLFDVFKPYPANRLEALPGGSGIMSDDLAAGVYACLVLHGALRLAPGLLGQA